jgi:hypothetical protein
LKKSEINLAQSSSLEPKLALFNEIKNTIYSIKSESAHKELSESFEKSLGGQKSPLMQIVLATF